MKFQKNSVSKLALTDLLRRKRTNLVNYLTGNGIYSYELLASRCLSIGVIAPTEDQFLKARGTGSVCDISSPSEGIVVLQPNFSSNEELNKQDDHVDILNNNNYSVVQQEVTEEEEEEITTGQEITKQKRKKKIFVKHDV